MPSRNLKKKPVALHQSLSPAIKNDIDRVTLMKGVAIAAVVVLHILSSLPGVIFHQVPQNYWYILLDQFGRFCVPVFIGVSGYALTRRYASKLEIGQFYSRRIVKLIPLYLLWSFGLWGLFLLIPAWYSTADQLPLWQILFLGSGDYHLYFVPLIFQLYLLFPLLLWVLKRSALVVLVAAIAVQIIAFALYKTVTGTSTSFFATDQGQYILFVSWLSYFVMGMWLGLRKERRGSLSWLTIFAGGVSLVTLMISTSQAVQGIATGVDPLHALKFTRWVMIPYGLSWIVLSVGVPWEKLTNGWIKRAWLLIGEWSFIIFLAHTLLLRLVFARHYPGVTMGHLALAVAVLVIGVACSRFLEKR